ncbi:hypothetical protein MoryE10_21460 [Methylogaea oryzae]|uniref:Ubiquinone biosynthesis accessory factor UbiK n=2 Tax=Methylogaea oryzae TaxID=1295382 RepID=A0A8D4VP94_9GAMM|nr:hypothetical protein MoryE10_21460 [Methylogaea oryzae]
MVHRDRPDAESGHGGQWTLPRRLGYAVRRFLPIRTPMIDPSTLDDISRRLGAALPPGLHALRKDLEKTFHGVLQGAFHSMNLVNREEFDVQSAVLARTRAKLESLEAQVAELEKKLLER